jgi:hypothetical protein
MRNKPVRTADLAAGAHPSQELETSLHSRLHCFIRARTTQVRDGATPEDAVSCCHRGVWASARTLPSKAVLRRTKREISTPLTINRRRALDSQMRDRGGTTQGLMI